MLIIGLGNPGSQYTFTRHNVGFLAIDSLANYCGASWQESAKFEAEFANIVYRGKKLYFLKPQTFMNLSGRSAIAIKNYYKIELSDIVVIHDELDLELGSLRCKIGGGSAGHNGIKSLDSSIGKDYHRIRMGIGRPEGQMDPSDYVLGKFAKDEQIIIDEVIADIRHNFDMIIDKDFEGFASKFKK